MDYSKLRDVLSIIPDYQYIHDYIGDGMDTFRDYYPYSLRARHSNIEAIRSILNSKSQSTGDITLTYYGRDFTVTPSQL